MAKKDFMSELAAQVAAEKRGERTNIDGIDNFKPKNRPEMKDPEPEEEPQPEEEIKETEEVKPQPTAPAEPQEEPSAEEPADDDEPDSFGEETFVKIDKPKRQIRKPVLIGLIAAAATVVVLLVYFFFVPKIVMPDFVNGTEYDHTLTAVSNWARQYQISTTSIAQADPQYSDTVAKGDIMAQSVEAGTRIKKDTPITFTLSNGPDPNVAVSFPDIRSMTKDEIDSWAKENLLLNYKATTQYSDTVEDGNVISYEVKNGDEAGFTRGTTLNVVISKGSAPAGQVTVTSFVNKTYAEASSWATTNKVTAQRVDTYSDTVAADTVISQSIAAGSTMKQGDTIIFTVSKGKGITIPNLVGYSAEQFDAWQKANTGITVVPTTIYNEAPVGQVLSQSIAANTVVDSGTVLEVTTSLYLPILQTDSQQWIKKDYLALKAWVDDVNSHGANIQAGEYGDFANRASGTGDKFGTIEEIACSFGTSNDNNGCDRPLSLNARIAYRISDGTGASEPTAAPTATPAPSQVTLTPDDMKDLTSIQNFCNANSGTVSCTFQGGSNSGLNIYLGEVSEKTKLHQNENATLVKGAELTIVYQAQSSSTSPSDSPNP